ncbi:MAG: DDE-type integrase/transposase/recombinase [Lewinellaceae bacterium]|nr:DDE-type integrase/transposase/recombinase [Phaeodactylibacter sp.]MCB9035866.1 DDE-type integrase/transposase/recombinase [Lewinellaceae bacterium]
MEALKKFKLIKPHLEQGIPLTHIAQEKQVPLRTMRRWAKRYREHGLSGLEAKPRCDKNRRRSVSEELEQMARAFALQKPRLNIATIHRKIAALAKQQGQAAPKYNVIYDIVQKMDPRLIALAHEGSVAYRNKYELIYRRETSCVNEIWQADHTLLDILLVDEKGNPTKPWLTIIEDDYSRAISGYYLSFDYPCAVNTALALRQAIWRKDNPQWQVCGIPEILYTDNGGDFISEHIEKVCASLKIRMINSIPGRPQGKGRVERFFLTLLQQLLEELPGYAPGDATRAKASLALEQFSVKLEDFIIHTYHQTPHSVTGVPPIERWLGDGFLPQLPESLEQLDLLLLTVPKSRKVHRDGIRFKQFRYMSPTLAAFVGEQVTVRYDPRDLAEIRVYLDGEFICPAICQDIAGQVVSLKEIKKARQKVKRGLRKEINDAKQLLRDTHNSSEPSPETSTIKKKSRLKLYRNE